MTHEVARILAQALEPLLNQKILTTLCGLAKLVATTSATPGSPVKRFPIPFDTDARILQMDNGDLVPDQNQAAILYFEETSSQVTEVKDKGIRMSCGLRLVCWYNTERMPLSHTQLFGRILSKLKDAKKSGGDIQALTLTFGTVQNTAGLIFSPYTYREEKAQFMQPPYYAFSVSINAEYSLNLCKTDD